MKSSFFYTLLIVLFLSSCSHKVVRIGYEVNSPNSKNSHIAIKKNSKLLDEIKSKTIKIGEIKIKDTGFSTSCNEEDAISILKNDASAIEADLIIITKEKRPDLWSTCYRNNAAFYKYKDPNAKEKIISDISYKPENIKDRVSKDSKQNMLVSVGALITGVLLGTLLF